MSNIHGLHSIRNRDNRNSNTDDDDDDNDNRYVGGVDARGGGSGLAVQPNPHHGGGGGRDASDAIFNLADPSSSAGGAGGGGGGEIRRTITMYRSGFTVDSGPYRRLDDPANAEFLTSLARGMVPRELSQEASAEGGEGEVMVGLVDRRGEEYDPERHGQSDSTGGASGGSGFQSFSGEGQSLGTTPSAAASSAASSGGVIDPNSAAYSTPAPEVDASRPSTSIAVRLLNGKRLVVKINLDSPVLALGQHIGHQAGSDRYVLTAGYPPRVVENLSQTVEEAGLKGAQVVLKKA